MSEVYGLSFESLVNVMIKPCVSINADLEYIMGAFSAARLALWLTLWSLTDAASVQIPGDNT